MIGEILRELRKKKGLTMKQFGELFQLGESTISMYENDKRSPDYDSLKMFANYFGVSTDYLLGISDTTIPKNTKKEPTSFDKLVLDVEQILINENVIKEGEDLSKDIYEDLVDVIKNSVSSYSNLRNKFLNKND